MKFWVDKQVGLFESVDVVYSECPKCGDIVKFLKSSSLLGTAWEAHSECLTPRELQDRENWLDLHHPLILDQD